MPVYIAVEQQEDGHWLADAVNYPGILAYGLTRDEALASVQVLLFRALRDHADGSSEPPEAADERHTIILMET